MRYCFYILVIILFGCNAAEQKTKEKSKQLPYYSSAAFTPEWYESNDTALKNVHTIPSFSFINQDSQMVTNKTFDGKIYVANFFFTSCPGICKNLTNNLKTIQKAFEKDDTVLLLSHSVTPERDDVKALKVYATNNGVISNKWHLITGNKNDVYNIARQAYFADEDLGKQLTVNDFLHTENVLLIDKHKRIRGIYKGISSLEMQNLIHDIQLLKQEN